MKAPTTTEMYFTAENYWRVNLSWIDRECNVPPVACGDNVIVHYRTDENGLPFITVRRHNTYVEVARCYPGDGIYMLLTYPEGCTFYPDLTSLRERLAEFVSIKEG